MYFGKILFLDFSKIKKSACGIVLGGSAKLTAVVFLETSKVAYG